MKRNVLVTILLFSLLFLWYFEMLCTNFSCISMISKEIVDTRQQVQINATKHADVIITTPKSLDLKYILQWTKPNNVPFVDMRVGQSRFIERKCQFFNCYVTSNRSYLDNYTLFDVIVFSGPEMDGLKMHEISLPCARSVRQKYVFASIESSQYYPVCSNRFDGYFNWTWTFRLDSESRWGYIVVRDKQNKIIGPNKIMHWMRTTEMEPVSEEFKNSLKFKTKAVAWFVSNCFSLSRREVFAVKLERELKKYDLTVDIYGACGILSCPRNNEKKCDKIIKTTYYFYLAFENSFGEDYVTEKLLRGLRNNAIPIVYGGANYTRFMPDGIYLNARELGVENLAQKMHELIMNPDKYVEYFKWKNHYSYHRKNENSETDDYCSMCALLNNEEMMMKKSVRDDFRAWWDSPKTC